nr:extracellular solute-binding protein [uncultured Acetatifactor sp.]
MRKFLSMTLAAALVLGLTACGDSGEASGSASGSDAGNQTGGVESGEENQETPAEATTLSVMMYDRGNTTETYGSATDNYWTHWVQKEFGDPNNITVTFVPVPRSQDAEKVNTLMAGDEAPDIIFSYDSNMIMQFGKDGGLVELSDLIQQYGPNLQENLAETMSYGQSEGNQWAIVAKRADVGWHSMYIRKDWLDDTGYTLQTDADGIYHMSIDDFTDLLHQFKDLDPSGQGSEMFPLGLIGAWDAGLADTIIKAFIDTPQLTDEMHACYNDMFWPGYKEGVRYLNQLYNEGMADPDFMVDTDASYTSFNGLLSNGRILAFGHDAAEVTGVKALYETDADAEVVPFYLDNVNGEQFNRVYAPTGMYIAVPATCKNPENAIKYLDWLSVWDNAKVFHYGFEGVHYNLEGDTVVTISYTDEEKAASEYDFERITVGDFMLVYNGKPYGYKDSTEGMDEVTAKMKKLVYDAFIAAEVGGQADYYFQGIKTEADEKYAGLLPGLGSELPTLITCKPEEFDAAYDKVLQDWLDAGGQEVLDQKIELYKELEAAK